jgi:hypothetical protein
MIAEMQPPLNRCPGGGGSRATPRVERKPEWLREMERIGTRAYAARFLLTKMRFEPEMQKRVEQVAYGAA